MGRGLLYHTAGNRGVDEGETAFLPVHGDHDAYVADGTHSGPFPKENQVSFLQVGIAVDGAAFAQLDGAVGCEFIPEVFVHITRVTGTVKAFWPHGAQLVRCSQEGAGIRHHFVPGRGRFGLCQCRPGKQDGHQGKSHILQELTHRLLQIYNYYAKSSVSDRRVILLIAVRVDDMPSEGKIDGSGDFEIYVPTEDMTFGRHLVSVELVETDSQKIVACKYIAFDLLDFVLKLVDQATGEESWNLFARVGLGKKYFLKLQTGADVPLNATLKNNLNGKIVAGNASSDGKDYSFTLTDDILVSGQQDLVILLSKQDREVAHVGITLIGLNSFVCKYSIEGDSVYATFFGNGNSFPFDTYHSISVYLIGVIPYTEAVGSPSQHHDIECFEEKDIDAVGMHFTMSQNETFSKKKIFTSSYFKYLSSYLNEQLGKIKAAHSSTRWKKTGNSWQKETYWPVPYIRMEFYLDERRVDGMPFDDYFDLSYETALVESFLSQYGVQTQVFH